MAHIVSITYSPAAVAPKPPDRYARVAVERAVLVEGHGIEGDSKGRRGRRQLNVLSAEIVESLRAEGFRTGPGELGEQIVIAGLPSNLLAVGLRLRVGTAAVIEVTLPRTPCHRFARVQGRPAASARGRVGFMARVVSAGEIAIGDTVCVEQAAANGKGG